MKKSIIWPGKKYFTKVRGDFHRNGIISHKKAAVPKNCGGGDVYQKIREVSGVKP